MNYWQKSRLTCLFLLEKHTHTREMVRFKNDYFPHSGKKTTFQITMQNSAEGHNNSFKNRKIIMTFREEQLRFMLLQMSIVRGKWIITMKRRDEFWISRKCSSSVNADFNSRSTHQEQKSPSSSHSKQFSSLLRNMCITRCGFQQWPHLFALCHTLLKELFGRPLLLYSGLVTSSLSPSALLLELCSRHKGDNCLPWRMESCTWGPLL